MQNTGDITKKYREMMGLSGQEFVNVLCDELPGKEYPRQQVSHWELGQAQVPYDLALLVWIRYSDWRSEWALDVLRMLRPDIWAI